MNLHNGTQLSWTNKLKWNELNIIFSSFAFNMVNAFIEIWIRFGLIESNSIQYKLVEFKLNWNQIKLVSVEFFS
jgi:hypothetical protein